MNIYPISKYFASIVAHVTSAFAKSIYSSLVCGVYTQDQSLREQSLFSERQGSHMIQSMSAIMRKTLLFLSILVVLSTPIHASDFKVNRKIHSLSVKIVGAYMKLPSREYRNSLAVATFDDATGKDIGFGASELITTDLINSGKFVVVERKQLEKILREQRLSLSGLIDPESTIKIGKLLGADMLLVGSVAQLGDYYNIFVRLLETETGQCLLSEKVEIEADLLEESTSRLVPKKEKIGIYFIHNYRYCKNDKSYQIELGWGGTGTERYQNYHLHLIGAGVKYMVLKHFFLNISFRFSPMKPTVGRYVGWLDSKIMSFCSISALMEYVYPISSKINISFGGGGNYNITSFDKNTDNVGIMDGNYFSAIAQVQIEYLIATRMAISLGIDYESVDTIKYENFETYPLQISPLSIETKATLYF